MKSPAERRRKQVRLIVGSMLVVLLCTFAEVHFFDRVAPTFGSRVIVFLLLNLNLLALFWLVLFVGRSLIKLAIERRQGIAGHKFKTKVVGIFLLMISMPLMLMFVVSSELVTNYIDRFFTPQFRKPVEGSLKVAQTLYMLERMRVLDVAHLAVDGSPLPSRYTATYQPAPSDSDTAAVQAAFKGREESEVITQVTGDTIRAAIPVFVDGEISGAVVVETTLPPEILDGINSIKRAYEDYMHLEAWKSPLKMSYLLMLAFFTLIIVFVAIWISLRIAGWMTEPVKDLSLATAEVAAGNFSVHLESTSQDEMGTLIDSFNNMVQEIRESKNSLQQAYANLDNIVKSIQSGVVSIGQDRKLASINEAACRIFNVTPEEVIGHNYTVLLSGVDSMDLDDFIKSIRVEAAKPHEREIWITVGNKKILLRISISFMRAADGSHVSLLAVFDDITDVIKAQRTLAWQEVARRMAHEIKNPLTPIKLSAERMVRKWQKHSEDFDQVFDKSTQTIIREVDSLKAMVDEFSRFGKLPEIRREPTDMRVILAGMKNLYKGYKQLNVSLDLPANVPTVEIDSDQLKRVMINLIDNAIEAMGGIGDINIRVRFNEAANRMSIHVMDNGPGIDKDDKEKLFQPYFSTKKDGTGLGLAIADRIIAEHGGSVAVYDNTPTGSVFIVEVPIHV